VKFWYAWDILQVKYDAIEITNIMENMARDIDLQIILKGVLKVYKKISKEMENILIEYAIPMPERPPEKAVSTLDVEAFSDRYIFNATYEIVQSVLPVVTTAFSRTISPEIRSHCKIALLQNIDSLEKLMEYGKLKNYLNNPLSYRT